jgi:plasmid rolling circle replication initiator protein Rep
LKNNIDYKIIPGENDKRVKNKAIHDDMGNYLPLQDGRAHWQARKGYSVNFAKVLYMLGAEELKKVENIGTLNINKKTGEVFDTPEARKYFLKSQHISECGLRLAFKIDSDGNKKLSNAYFCRDRLCPVCMWRLSRRLAWETNQIVDKYMEQCPEMIPIMIGLTVQNPKIGELSKMLDVLCHGDSGAWQLLRKWLARRGIKDYIRTVEVTFNAVSQTWHPHIHVLAFVPKDYFSKENKKYISHEILGREWQRICNLDYKPVVDIRRCYDKNSANERIKFDSDIKIRSFAGAIKETAKYCVKPLKLFSHSLDNYADGAEEKKEKVNIKDVVWELDSALSGRRLRALGGKLKEIAKKLKFDTEEDKKDLIHNDDNGLAEAIYEEVYEYVFEDKDYYLTVREKVEREQEDIKIDNRRSLGVVEIENGDADSA